MPVFNQWIVITKNPYLNLKFKLPEVLITISVNIYIIIKFQDPFYVIYANTFFLSLFSILRLFCLLMHTIICFEKDYFYEFIKIGYPIFFRSGFNQLQKQIDRIIVTSLYSLQTFAIYDWSLKLLKAYETLEKKNSFLFFHPYF